jgi:hypothetical protein
MGLSGRGQQQPQLQHEARLANVEQELSRLMVLASLPGGSSQGDDTGLKDLDNPSLGQLLSDVFKCMQKAGKEESCRAEGGRPNGWVQADGIAANAQQRLKPVKPAASSDDAHQEQPMVNNDRCSFCGFRFRGVAARVHSWQCKQTSASALQHNHRGEAVLSLTVPATAPEQYDIASDADMNEAEAPTANDVNDMCGHSTGSYTLRSITL